MVLPSWDCRGKDKCSLRNHSHTRRADPSSAKRANTARIAEQTASSGWNRTSPSCSPQTHPTGKLRRISPRDDLLRRPAERGRLKNQGILTFGGLSIVLDLSRRGLSQIYIGNAVEMRDTDLGDIIHLLTPFV